ncbi:hypothetical protein, partial [uncultured Faecalibaculum sp.]|uniref:hypothetical protein n=1 Tax=uncultured Faecalibaculum sp. TaxID=1729681 RepID=UPI00260FD8AF
LIEREVRPAALRKTGNGKGYRVWFSGIGKDTNPEKKATAFGVNLPGAVFHCQSSTICVKPQMW